VSYRVLENELRNKKVLMAKTIKLQSTGEKRNNVESHNLQFDYNYQDD
jgi:hypothetical protein